MVKVSATEPVDSHKKSIPRDTSSKLKFVKRFKQLKVFKIYFAPKLIHTLHVFNADVKEL